MKGTYVLLARVPKRQLVKVGSLGEIEFREGMYAYVGSAMNSLEGRIGRHLKKKGKKMHWHIDYLLAGRGVSVGEVYFSEGAGKKECEIAQILGQVGEPVPKFGCSDCKCRSHLFRIGDAKAAIERLGMEKWQA